MADGARTRLDGIALVSLCVAVGAAFADSSIVVLALPQLLVRLHSSVESVSWVITAYNLVVAVVALLLVGVARPGRARAMLAAGVLFFLAGSAGCAAAGTLGLLVAFRCVQGLGGALLLVASLPLLGALTGSRRRGIALWAFAGAIGAAVGPALGGVLTQAFDWRSIFVLQVPLAALAAVALAARLRPAREDDELRHPRERLASNLAIALVSGALVGALFLAVVLLIAGWRLSPIAAAAIVSILPLATLATRRAARHIPRAAAPFAGTLALAGGLGGLALLPSRSIVFAALSLCLCGLGLGLAVPPLTSASLDVRAPEQSGALTTGARHAGLVLALVLVTPLLAHDLRRAEPRAIDRGANVVLDSGVSITTKVPLIIDLSRTLHATPQGEVPDFGPAFARHGGGGSVAELQRRFTEAVYAVVTRSSRRAFALTALLALAALIPLGLLLRRGRPA